MIKKDILAILGASPELQKKFDQYPLLAKKAEAFATDMENSFLSLAIARPTYKIKPKSPTTVEEAIAEGHYIDHYKYLKNKVNAKIFRDRPLDLPEEEIIIGILPKGDVIPKGKVAEYWAERNLESVPYADAYLDQLMRDNTEDQLPEELKGIDIVAWSPEPTFRDGDGGACHLDAVRNSDGRRRLSMVVECDGWDGDYGWAFVLRKKNFKN